MPQTCRECGCTDNRACLSEEFGPCWWVEVDLCSHCEMGIECDRCGEQERALIRQMQDMWPCACTRTYQGRRQFKLHDPSVKRCRTCKTTKPEIL